MRMGWSVAVRKLRTYPWEGVRPQAHGSDDGRVRVAQIGVCVVALILHEVEVGPLQLHAAFEGIREYVSTVGGGQTSSGSSNALLPTMPTPAPATQAGLVAARQGMANESCRAFPTLRRDPMGPLLLEDDACVRQRPRAT